jgi:hypothetical protein
VDGDDSIGVVVAVARITMRLIAWLDPAPEGSDEEAQLERLESGWLNPPQALETVRNIVQAELFASGVRSASIKTQLIC